MSDQCLWMQASARLETPNYTLADALELVAYHCDVQQVSVPRGGVRRGGCALWEDPNGPLDGLHVHLDWEIEGQPAPESEPVWDQCRVRHHGAAKWTWVGNRCGLRNYIAREYAPVLAAIAAREAEES